MLLPYLSIFHQPEILHFVLLCVSRVLLHNFTICPNGKKTVVFDLLFSLTVYLLSDQVIL